MTLRDTIRQAARLTDSVIVGFSTGKDSIVALDLCRQHFKRVEAWFMYIVPGLEFQERYLRYIEGRYGLTIHRHPHWMLGEMFNQTYYRPDTDISVDCPTIAIADAEAFMMRKTGISWFAYGLKCNDSLERNAMIKRCGGIDVKTRRFYPVAWFSDKAIYAYLRQHRIRLPRDYELFGRSFGRLWLQELAAIKEHFPADYKKIQEYFPFVEAVIKRYEFGDSRAKAEQISEVPSRDDSSLAN